MTARPHRLAAATAGAFVLTLFCAGASQAGSWSGQDATGDVIGVTWDPEPKPCGTATIHEYPEKTSLDIRKLGIRHGDSRISLKATFVDLVEQVKQEAHFELLTAEKRFGVSARLRTNGEVKVELWKEQFQEPVPDPECGGAGTLAIFWSCPGLHGDADATHDVITVRLPRKCIKDPRWVKAGAWSIDWSDDTNPQDRWEPVGSEGEGGVFGPYGPKVFRG